MFVCVAEAALIRRGVGRMTDLVGDWLRTSTLPRFVVMAHCNVIVIVRARGRT